MAERAYYRAEDGDWCEYYDMLKGPDDFECLLTEPEDRTWLRDGRDVVTRLNEQHDEIVRLRSGLEMAWVIIANASGGDWESAHPEWRKSAERWRDTYVHGIDAARDAAGGGQ